MCACVKGSLAGTVAAQGPWAVSHRSRTAFVEEERSGEPGKCPVGRGRRSPAPAAGHDNPRGGLAMYENDYDVDVPTADELLAELGLDAYTIRQLRAEADGEVEFCSV
ncbi:MAG: hypothetical protein OXE44_13055 [Nitrospinae bacterium]|nr:hypothetical protein [Nitrospinota bacterium]